MTIVMPDLDMTVLESMEFAPSCEYVRRIYTPPCGMTAEWVYITLGPASCGCLIPDRFFCDDCKVYRQSITNVLFCVRCKGVIQEHDKTIYRFEPIGGSV